MGNFLHGWRRKTGLLSLALALALTAPWLRSYLFYDTVSLLCQASHHRFDSEQGRLLWQCDHSWTTNEFRRRQRMQFHWITLHYPDPNLPIDSKLLDPLHGYEVDWRWNWSQFSFGAGREITESAELLSDGGPSKLRAIFDHRVAWTIPYWSLVLPLTLIAAWLILGRPKRRLSRSAADSRTHSDLRAASDNGATSSSSDVR